ncbi:MAG: HAD family hydrolase [Verrucomicrobiae bacterium]|nr:HAD family hydrolase [Verrucomicrobiae bacterium]
MRQTLTTYLREHAFTRFDLKAVLFDMDGVLYDSMPAHDQSWQETMNEEGLPFQRGEFYLHEGRIGKATIDIIFQRNLQRDATEEEAERIYARKTELFGLYNNGDTIPGAREVLDYVKEMNLTPVLVTGSGQPSLLGRLDHHFPDTFTPGTMVTAFDVVNGKPDPEPFLKGLQKGGGLHPHQAIVIENAPLGIEAAVGAGIFTIAVNTGPLPDAVLREAGASLVFSSMKQLREALPDIIRLTGAVSA